MHGKNHNLYQSLIILCFFISALISLVFLSVYFYLVSSTYSDYSSEMSTFLLDEIDQRSEEYFDDINNQLLTIYNSPAFLASLNDGSTSVSEEPARQLVAPSLYLSGLREVYIYNSSNTLRSIYLHSKATGTIDIVNDNSFESNTIKDFITNSSDEHVVYCYEGSNGKTYLRLIKRLYQNAGKDMVGYIVCDLNPNNLQKLANTNKRKAYQHIWLMSADGNICMLSNNNNENTEEFIQKHSDLVNRSAYTLSNFRTQYAQSDFSEYKLMTCVYTDPSNIEAILGKMITTFLYSLLTGLLLFFIFGQILSHKTSLRIKSIENILSQISSGNKEIRLPNAGNDEISMLCKSFNKTLDKLSEVEMIETETRKELANARYNILQAQVNPHFLFNTLETIGAIALAKDCPIINDMCESLAQMMRYSISSEASDNESSLKDELIYVDNFMRIINIRMNHAIKFINNIDMSSDIVNYIHMPKLTIQPIVENAVRHGLKRNYGEKRITLDVNFSDKTYIFVTDNGIFDDTDSINTIIHNTVTKNESHHTSIGLHNIESRIVLLYGSEYGISAKYKNSSTVVTIALPTTPEFEGKTNE